MSDTSYNGWSNWATWNMALWLDNDESFYNIRRCTRWSELLNMPRFLNRLDLLTQPEPPIWIAATFTM